MTSRDEVKEQKPNYSTSPDQFSFDLEPIRGYPELRWTGKRPFKGTSYYPAQLKETHGDTVDGWRNKIFWGDNLQVMSHLLRKYRGKVKLIYIDPPFDSKADYKKKIELRGASAASDTSAFEEKQYTDIWTNDEYLQFMYERLILLRELLADDGSIYVHCDWHKNHFLRSIFDEVFGSNCLVNELIWRNTTFLGSSKSIANKFPVSHNTIFWYCKNNYIFNKPRMPYDEEYLKRFQNPDNDPNGPWQSVSLKTYSQETFLRLKEEGALINPQKSDAGWRYKFYLKDAKGKVLDTLWLDINMENSMDSNRTDYPTQKPEALLERIIKASSNPGDLVFDCFMGSGTTQAVAMKLGRRFLGADINLGAVQTTTKRLLQVAAELKASQVGQQGALELNDEIEKPSQKYTGFEVYTVNHYDFFRNEMQARELLLEALEVQRLPGNNLWDGEKDGWMIKVLGINRLATAADLNSILGNLDLRAWERKARETPNQPVERIRFVCMGHDPDLKAQFMAEMDKLGFKVELEVLDILRDKQELHFKRDSEARLAIEGSELIIKEFYPMNLLQKLSLEQTQVADWRELVDSILIDFNYDGTVFTPTLDDIPGKKDLVHGRYPIPADAGTIRVKITDLLSESWEGEIR